MNSFSYLTEKICKKQSLCIINKANSTPRLLLGEAPAAAGDEGTPRELMTDVL